MIFWLFSGKPTYLISKEGAEFLRPGWVPGPTADFPSGS